MLTRPAFIVLLFAAALIFETKTSANQPVLPNLKLEGFDGNQISLSRDPSINLHVLCFLGTECPMAKSYGPKLERISEQYSDRGVRFIGVMSNVQDSIDETRFYAETHGITFPLGKDRDQIAANAFGATRTPEVVVLDRAGNTRYRGRIDNQYQPGVAREKATEHDLVDAINAILEGSDPPKSSTVAVGCLIGRNQKEVTDFSVTYCKQISRILNQNCVECHRDKEIGPFRLDQYEEVIGWGEMCVEVIQQDRMPPWHANDRHQVFANARKMQPKDKQLLEHWVAAGMPYGNASDLPPQQQWVSGWRLPKEPDEIFPMSNTGFQVPAEGTVEYQYFVVDPKFENDRWVRAAEVLPGNASVVHHCIVFIRPPDGAEIRQAGLLSAYVPGHIRSPLPDGFAQRVPAGSRLVFQMHYTPTGKAQEDLTRLGLVFMEEEEVTHEVIAIGGAEQDFEIPPNAPRHDVSGKVPWLPKNGYLMSIMPHMHLRGKSFTFSARTQERTEMLLEVPEYDFNWQHNYELMTPLPLQEISSLQFTATFDNSSDNPFNPDPNERVFWGDQTWQEMAVVYLTLAQPLNADSSQPLATGMREEKKKQTSTEIQSNDEPTAEQIRSQHAKSARQFAVNYMRRFDANNDGFIEQHELPNAAQLFLFRRMDRNGDELLDETEIMKEALRRPVIPQSLTERT